MDCNKADQLWKLVGANIARERKSYDLSVEALGALSNIPAERLRDVEAGLVRITAEEIIVLCNTLGIKISRLLGAG